MEKKLKGLPVDIYSAYGHQSPMNVFSKFKTLILVEGEALGPFEVDEQTPGVRIVRRNIKGIGEYIHAEPMKRGSYAMGGTFIFTSDSRFRDISNYPIPLHDRDLSLEQDTMQ